MRRWGSKQSEINNIVNIPEPRRVVVTVGRGLGAEVARDIEMRLVLRVRAVGDLCARPFDLGREQKNKKVLAT